ncbi:MAG: hypothetical protein JO211_00640, partial [Acidobacteriaceae bacterium]|nr:hypothetical protein [Acidobacteriaceae bacterium]
MEEWRYRARTFVVRSSRARPIRGLFRKLCQIGTWIVGRNLAGLPGVASVYVRHSHPGSATFAPGQSDLDLTLVLDDAAAQDVSVIRACGEMIRKLSRIFYFVWPQDVRFTSRRELAQMEALPGAAEIMNAPNRWTRIGGREVRRRGLVAKIANSSIALHPEFNGWWLNVLQSHVLTPQTEFAERNMRLCFRVAMKSQLHFAAARAQEDPSGEAYLPDSRAASLFEGDPEMRKLLSEIQRNDFWIQDPEGAKARIFHRCLTTAADFYRNLPLPSDAVWVELPRDRSPSVTPEHRADLQARFEQQPALRSIAEAIIVYPTPHWFPREYQIDVLLRDDVSLSGLRDAVSVIKRSLHGRTFGVLGSHAQITLIPRDAFKHRSFLLGTPFPFLHDHIANFAETLVGTPPRVPAPPTRWARLEWLAQYYFFHRFTLRYRPRYVSKDCNFSQLAAIRMYLEQGLIYTDAADVSREY